MTVIDSNEGMNGRLRGKQDLVILYAVSSYCSAIIRKIRSNDTSVPIVLIVNEEFKSKYVGTLGIGETDVLMKPFPEDELVRLIDKYKMVKI